MDTHLDKQVNPDGIELSGGEAQKLMMARALYKDAPVLVLDEPTAALDPIAENEVYEQYRRMAAGKTSLFISHRLASTRFCDRIVLLRDGGIAEEGTHETLLAAGGEYARLYEFRAAGISPAIREGSRHERTLGSEPPRGPAAVPSGSEVLPLYPVFQPDDCDRALYPDLFFG